MKTYDLLGFLHKTCRVLVNKMGYRNKDVAALFGRSEQWVSLFIRNGPGDQIWITKDMLNGLRKLGYDIRIIKIEKGANDEQGRKTTTEEKGSEA